MPCCRMCGSIRVVLLQSPAPGIRGSYSLRLDNQKILGFSFQLLVRPKKETPSMIFSCFSLLIIVPSSPAPKCYHPPHLRRWMTSICITSDVNSFSRMWSEVSPAFTILGTRWNTPCDPLEKRARTSEVLSIKSRGARSRVLFHPTSHLFRNYLNIIQGVSVESCCLRLCISARLTNLGVGDVASPLDGFLNLTLCHSSPMWVCSTDTLRIVVLVGRPELLLKGKKIQHAQ